VNLAPIRFELLLPDAEKLCATRLFFHAQQVVYLLHHRRSAATTVDDGRLVTKSCAVQGCRHSGGATADHHDFVLVLRWGI
jgi:hypothetical protein